jgi:CRP/FNR family cyclic AMP-dependent transcriptional regulator
MAVTNPLSRLPALRRVPIFGGLAKATLLEVARRVMEVAHPAGTTLVREGDPGDALCIIVEGTVEVIKDGRGVAQMTGGDFFGEISLIDGKPRSATVVAVEDTVLLMLGSSDFQELLNIPLVARAALESVAQRLREAHDA